MNFQLCVTFLNKLQKSLWLKFLQLNNVAGEPAVLASPGNLLQIQTLRAQSGPSAPEPAFEQALQLMYGNITFQALGLAPKH